MILTIKVILYNKKLNIFHITYVYLSVCVCVCVCVSEREREREGEGERRWQNEIVVVEKKCLASLLYTENEAPEHVWKETADRQ